MGAFIGIDLGTTYSAVSFLDETGRPKILANKDGQNITPSCIDFSEDTIIVGEDARKGLGINAVAARFKRDMGTSTTYELNGHKVTPTECSALVLKKLVQDTTVQIGDIDSAVVTIPANYANEAREATLKAAKDAGLKVDFIVNEPTAAALFYAHKNNEELHGHYAVYDLGGGTFDLSILKVNGQDVDVVTSDGIHKLGGSDFDEALQKIVRNKYEAETGEKSDEEDYTRTDAEEDKKSLSKRDSIKVRINRKNITVTKDEFVEAISSMIAQTEMLCDSVVAEAGIEYSDIKEVLLVGGSTRVPAVLESVKKTFGKDPVTSENVDEIVALGASLYCAFKGNREKLSNTQKKSIEKIKVAESTTKCFGTIALGVNAKGEKERQVMILINKNEKIPCSVTESVYSSHDNQKEVRCSITESTAAETDPKFVNIMWEEMLDLGGDKPQGQEIKVTYSYDENQTMNAVFLDVESGKELKTSLSMKNNDDSDSDIEKFIVE